MRGMAQLGYSAINLADKDLNYGVAFLDEMQQKHRLPFVSANVHRKDNGGLYAEPFKIVTAGDIRIGIFGVADAPLTAQAMKDFEIKDAAAAAKEMVAKLSSRCDVIVALSHLGIENSKKLAADIAGIDIMISGHRWDMTRSPEIIGKTVMMQSGSKGKYLGHLDFEYTNTEVKLNEGKVIALSAQIKEDAGLSALVKEFDRKSGVSENNEAN